MQNNGKAKFVGALRSFIASFKRTMFPEGYVCLGCGKELRSEFRDQSLCPECLEALPFKTGKTCAICGTNIYVGRLCRRCSAFTPEFDRAVAPFNYNGLARKFVLDLKIGGKVFLARYMADYMANYIKGLQLKFDLVTAVPSTKKTLRQRGFDHTELIAAEFSELVEMPYRKLLLRTKHKLDQSRLSFADRFNAVKGNFSAMPDADITGMTVLLIDDILTSGATASECAAVLKKQGAKRVYVLTFAR